MGDVGHKGHRQRMRSKFSDFGARCFNTYELLEMLLYYTVPVKDTKASAKSLLSEFGSLDGVLSASVDELTKVEGVGKRSAELIHLTGKVLGYIVEEERDNSRVFDNYDVLGRFVASHFTDKSDYAVLLFSFDNCMKLLGVDELYQLDCASGGIKSDLFVNTLIRREAAVAVVAHNHPHGPICPSLADNQTNLMLFKALKNVGIVLAEHYLVVNGKYFGFMSRNMNDLLFQSPELDKFYESKEKN